MADDFYGIDLALTADGQLQVSPTGDMAAWFGPDNVVQALKLRMRTIPGDLSLHPDYGSQLMQLIGRKAIPEILTGTAITELRTIVTSDNRFSAARNVEVATQGMDHGAAAIVSCELVLASGDVVSVSDLASGSTTVQPVPVTDLTYTTSDLAGVDVPDYLPQDEEEADMLANYNELADMATDLSFVSIEDMAI